MNSELDHIQLSTLLVGEWYKDISLLTPEGQLLPQQPPSPQPAATQQALPQQPAPPTPRSVPEQRATPGQPTAPEQRTTPERPTAPGQAPQAAPQSTVEPVAEQAPRAMPEQPPQTAAGSAPEQGPRTTEETAPYKFLGKNGKKVTIVVQSPGVPFLPDNQLTFLIKILEACRMNIGDVAIVNAATVPVQISILRQQLQPTAVLLFGIEPTAIKLPINFPEFKVQPYDNCSYLSAPPLTRLVQQSEESKLLKSKLWVCLKTLFNV
jgi:hypothetical protein